MGIARNPPVTSGMGSRRPKSPVTHVAGDCYEDDGEGVEDDDKGAEEGDPDAEGSGDAACGVPVAGGKGGTTSMSSG